MTTTEAIVALWQLGYGVRVHGGTVQVRPPYPEPAGGREPRSVLRTHSTEAAELLGWPPDCLESEVRFGHRAARLYPLLGHTVVTPLGEGRLDQVLGDMATVVVAGGADVLRVQSADVRPWVPSAEASPTSFAAGAGGA